MVYLPIQNFILLKKFTLNNKEKEYNCLDRG